MKPGDRVMVVANHAIREDQCGMATLESYVSTGRNYGGYLVETWVLVFDGEIVTDQCNMLVDESMRTK